MTGRFLVDLYESELLKLTGNIRPVHNREDGKLTGKTAKKVNKWTSELLAGNAIIGNISMRLDPTKSDYDIWYDEETGFTNMTVESGVLDCAVDSLSQSRPSSRPPTIHSAALTSAPDSRYGSGC